ncbi:hypothetical protein F5Y15DRAFT_385765 [Xylariaceae sp. FL0016]|nr:hypothetical protein F5Y15DRAFT_385765 [Xylariaceae sp. FL0016]
MSDARSLLRAHRQENRIKHPHAAYSDAGKLLCKLCHEAIKTESLWDSHMRGQHHKQKLQALQNAQSQNGTSTDEGSNATKRKLGDVDESMSDAEDDTDAVRKKRSRTEAMASARSNGSSESEKTQTPPSLRRRTSGTPAQGVEIAIPSRPATPLAGSNSNNSTPKIASNGRSLSTGAGPEAASMNTAAKLPISTESLTVPGQQLTQASFTITPQTIQVPNSGAIDESEWAAFEAEIAAEPVPPATVPDSKSAYTDATIFAPAMTSAQLAAKSQEEENERRKVLLDTQIADEKEDATRQLEEEFEEMEELEGRVRRLKERREELRKESMANIRDAAQMKGAAAKKVSGGKENNSATATNGNADDEEESEDDDDDDWDGFRFRA